MALQPTESSVRYGAETKLLELAVATCKTKHLEKVVDKIQQGVNIRLWLKALNHGQYLSFEEREKIWLCLLDLAQVYDYPIAPRLNPIATPVTIGGGNTVNVTNNYSAGTPFQNADIDGTEVVDSFPVTSARGAVWFYTVRKSSDQRSGMFMASWLADGSSIVTQHDSTTDIGDTSDVTLNVDFNAGNIRLLAIATSSDWILEGVRSLIYIQ